MVILKTDVVFASAEVERPVGTGIVEPSNPTRKQIQSNDDGQEGHAIDPRHRQLTPDNGRRYQALTSVVISYTVYLFRRCPCCP